MYRSELPYFIIFSIIIMLTPFIPSGVLMIADNVLVRILIIFALLFLISVGPTAGLFGLITIGVIYLERNRRKIIVARNKLDAMDIHMPPQMTVEQESKPQQTVPVLAFDRPPRDDEMPYIPSDDCDSVNFYPVAPTINDKQPLKTSYPFSEFGAEQGASKGLSRLYEEQGLGHIDGVETLGDPKE